MSQPQIDGVLPASDLKTATVDMLVMTFRVVRRVRVDMLANISHLGKAGKATIKVGQRFGDCWNKSSD